MISFAILLAIQFAVALLGYLSASITIRRTKPTKPLAMIILGFISIAGAVAIMVFW
jgi:hypothetical protein